MEATPEKKKKATKHWAKGTFPYKQLKNHEMMEIRLTHAGHSHTANAGTCPERRVRGQYIMKRGKKPTDFKETETIGTGEKLSNKRIHSTFENKNKHVVNTNTAKQKMFCHRFSLTFINPRSSTALTVDILPSPIGAGEALAPQPAEGRTELIPPATMGHLNPEFCPAPCSYSHHAEPSEDPEGFFLPVCSHQTPPMSSQPKKKELFPSLHPSQVPLTQPWQLCGGKKGPERLVRLRAAQLRQQNSADLEISASHRGSIPTPHIKCIYGVRNTQGRGRIPGL